MAETPEAKVKRFIDKTVETALPGVWKYRPPGTLFGRYGIPDHFFLWRGVFFVVEAKADDIGATPMQLLRLQEIKKQGGIAAVVSGKDLDKLNLLIQRVKERAEQYGLPISE